MLWLSWFIGGVQAQTVLYWDINGSTAGAGGASPSGIWSSSAANWSTSALGTTTTAAWSGLNIAAFSAGSDATGAFTATVTGTISLGGLSVLRGAVTVASAGGASDKLTLAQAANFNIGSSALVSSRIDGAYGLTKIGSGTLTLSGANAYTGVTTVSEGTLVVTNNSGLGTAAGGTTVAGGAKLDLQNVDVGAEPVTVLDGGTLATSVGNSSLAGTVTASGTVNATTLSVGGGQLTLSGASSFKFLSKSGAGTLVLSGPNTTDSMEITDGKVTVTSANALGGQLTMDSVFPNATLDLQNVALLRSVLLDNGTLSASTGTNSLNGSIVLRANSTVSVGPGAQLALPGIVSGAGKGLDKTGGGTLTLSGNNTYSGATTVSGGKLVVTNASGLGSTAGGTTVASGATLDLQNVAVGAEAVTIQNGGTLATSAGTSSLAGAVTGDAVGQATISVDGTRLTLTGTSTIDHLVKSGAGTLVMSGTGTIATMDLNKGTLAVTSSNALGGQLSIDFIKTDATLELQNVALARSVVMNGGGLSASTGTNSLSGEVVLGADSTVFVGPGAQLALPGIVSGAGKGLDKTGSGTLTLSGNNTYSGATMVSGGTLVVTNASGLGTTAAGTYVMRGATLDLQNVAVGAEWVQVGGALATSVGTSSLSGRVDLFVETYVSVGAGAELNLSGSVFGDFVYKTGTGTLVLSGNIEYFTSNVQEGTLAITSSASSFSSIEYINSGGTLDLRNVTIGNVDIYLNGGTLATSTGTSSVSGAVVLNANSTVRVDGTQLTLSGVVSGAGFGMTKSGNGTLTLSGANTYTGATTVGAGTLVVTDAAGLGTTDGGTTVASTATLDLQNVAVGAEAVTLNGGTLATNSGTSSLSGTVTLSGNSTVQVHGTQLTLSGVVSGPGFGLTKSGNGTLTLSGANTYTGATTVSAGTLALGASGVIADTSAVSVGTGATLNVGSVTETIGSLSGTGNVSLGSVGAAGALTTGADNTATTFSGVIAGAGSLTKTGTGTQTLSGANTYTGATTVSAGTLAVTNAAGLGTTAGGTTVASGATLDLQNVMVGAEAVTLSGGTLATNSGTSSLSGTVTLSANSTVQVNGEQLTLSGVVSGAGFGLTKSGNGTLTLSGANTYTGTTTVSAGTLALGGDNVVADSSNVVVALGATLVVGKIETLASISGSGTLVLAGGSLTLNANSSIGTLWITANSTLDFGSNTFATTNFIIDPGVTLTVNNAFLAENWWSDASRTQLASRYTRGTAPYNQVTITQGNMGSEFTAWTNTNFVTPIPEPGTYGAIFVGGMVVAYLVVRSRDQSSSVGPKANRTSSSRLKQAEKLYRTLGRSQGCLGRRGGIYAAKALAILSARSARTGQSPKLLARRRA